jgi:hypothetical protein
LTTAVCFYDPWGDYHREAEMGDLFTKAIAWLALAFVAVSVAGWCYAIGRAMFFSDSGATRTRRQSSDDDSVQWYDKSRP